MHDGMQYDPIQSRALESRKFGHFWVLTLREGRGNCPTPWMINCTVASGYIGRMNWANWLFLFWEIY